MKIVSIALIAIALPVMALAEVTVSIEQGKVTTRTDPDGAIVEEVIPLDGTVPGETVLYRYHVTNTGTEPAQDVVVRTDVPEKMTYISDSGQTSGWMFEVSADGHIYAPEGSLVIHEIDETSRPAEARDIRALRWRLIGTVAPGAALNTAFRASLDR